MTLATTGSWRTRTRLSHRTCAVSVAVHGRGRGRRSGPQTGGPTVSDIDRLREAAAVSTAYGIWADGPGRRGKTSVSQQVAALLRAVAEEGDHDERISGFQLWPNTYDAALALVDVILGGTDE